MLLYKLTDPDGYTRKGESGETCWPDHIGETLHAAPGQAELCSATVFHAYRDPVLGLLLNPVHAKITDPVVWFFEGDIAVKDWGKVGCKSITAIGPMIDPPVITTVNCAAFGILTSLELKQSPDYIEWANVWLSGEDRSVRSAYAAKAAYAAYYAAYCAAKAAYYAANAAYCAAIRNPRIDFISLAHRALEYK